MQQQIVEIPASQILADKNSRFGLLKNRIESLKNNILEVGGIMSPGEVEKLKTPVGGFKYRLTAGHYRHAAVALLEKEQPELGLKLPVIITEESTPLERLVRQISENHERQSQSPMDKAVAMKEMLDLGASKADVRARFSTPGVGRSGLKVQPASNSHVNMTLSFLELPKKLQTRIHSGDIGVAGAYELVKVFKTHPDKLDAVVARIDAAIAAAAEKEAAEEAKLVEIESKAAEEMAGAEAVKVEAEAARKAADATIGAVQKAKQKAAELASAKVMAESSEERKKAAEALKAAEKEAQEAEKARASAVKAADSLTKKAENAGLSAAERAAKLKTIRDAEAKKKATAPAKKAVGAAAVQKAAAKEGATAKAVALNAADMREFVHSLSIPGGDVRVEKIFREVKAAFNGLIDDREAYDRIVGHLDSFNKRAAKAAA